MQSRSYKLFCDMSVRYYLVTDKHGRRYSINKLKFDQYKNIVAFAYWIKCFPIEKIISFS